MRTVSRKAPPEPCTPPQVRIHLTGSTQSLVIAASSFGRASVTSSLSGVNVKASTSRQKSILEIRLGILTAHPGVATNGLTGDTESWSHSISVNQTTMPYSQWDVDGVKEALVADDEVRHSSAAQALKADRQWTAKEGEGNQQSIRTTNHAF